MLYIILSLIMWFVSPGFDFTNDQAVTAWYQRRTSKHVLMRQPAKPMGLVKVVQYDQKQVSVLFVSYERLICIWRWSSCSCKNGIRNNRLDELKFFLGSQA